MTFWLLTPTWVARPRRPLLVHEGLELPAEEVGVDDLTVDDETVGQWGLVEAAQLHPVPASRQLDGGDGGRADIERQGSALK